MKINNFKGLNINDNSYKVDPGSLELAENCILVQDNIISKSRGYKTFLSAATATPLALMDYKSKLINIGDSEIQVYNQDGSGDYSSTTTLTGQTISTTYPRYALAGGNAYITTDNFVTKLEDTSSSLLKAGVPKAPDLTYKALGSGTVNNATSGVHTPDTQIGYRVLFGRLDVNDNLVLGAPSEITANNNTLYSSSSVGLSSYDVTVTYTSHGLVLNDYVTIRNSNGTVAVPNGEYVVTAVPDANNFTFSTAAVLSSAPSGVTSLSFGIRRTPQLEFTIPEDCNTTAFQYKIYRTNASLAGDVEPDESTLQQIYEANLTSANLTAGYIQFSDTVDDLFKEGYLYTNPNTGEGILEANFEPPTCRDIAVFKNHSFYAYPTWPYTLDFSLIRSAASTFTNGDYFDVVMKSSFKTTTSAAWVSGTTVLYSVSDNTNLQVGQYILFSGFANSANNGKFIITTVNSTSVEVTNAGRTDNTLDESGLTLTSYPIRRYTAASSESFNSAAGGSFKLTTSSSSVATNIDETARSICRTVNRDTFSNIYISYVSSTIQLPGQMYAYGRSVTDTYSLQAMDSDMGNNFDPVLPVTSTDLTITGESTNYANGIAISKTNEYEAVPLTSFLLVGEKTAPIRRIFALKNSLIILKDDGIFRLSGNTRSDFIVSQLDPTVIIKAIDSCAILNGFVYALTTQGIVQISETSASIISRPIEPYILSLLANSNVDAQTFGHAQESNRLYLLTTMKPGSSTADITYVYNSLNDTWTTWTTLMKRGVIKSSDDRYYTIDLNGAVLKERKDQTKLDYCGDSTTSVTVSAVAVDGESATMTSVLVIEEGDIFVYDNTINRVTGVSGTTISFLNPVNFEAGDAITHYKRIISEFTFTPIVSGNTGTLTQFSEQTLQFRNNACTKLQLSWLNDNSETGYRGWEVVTNTAGWGEAPWGDFPWGQGETIDLDYTTNMNQPSRVFIPIQVQVGSWLKIRIKHLVAGETINLQEINVLTRNISSRIAK